MNNIDNKVAVITGAGSGIGRALALNLAKEGCHLAISDINQTTLFETEELLKPYQVQGYSQILDVSDKAAMEAYPGNVIQNLGGVNILINNAGVTIMATVEEHTIEDYEWLMGINFWGVLHGTKFFLPHLLKSNGAHIVNISSVFGLIAAPNQSAYSAAKFAVRGFTESLRHELRGSNIHVSCIHPGGVKSNISKNARFISSPGGKTHAQLNVAFEKFSKTTTDKTAKAIVKSIKKQKERVVVGMDAAFADVIQRIMPQRYGWMSRIMSHKF